MYLAKSIVPEIRNLPFDPTKESMDIIEFFKNDLPHRDECNYNFRKYGLNTQDGSLVLATHNFEVRAFFQIKSCVRFEHADGVYHGKFIIYRETIKLVTPIKFEEIQKIDLNFEKYPNVKQYININKLNEIIALLDKYTI